MSWTADGSGLQLPLKETGAAVFELSITDGDVKSALNISIPTVDKLIGTLLQMKQGKSNSLGRKLRHFLAVCLFPQS